MSNKGLLDVIEGLLNEGVNDDINKITADNQKKQKEHGHSADTQGVLGKTSGAAMDAGGDKDVGGMEKGKFASDASADTQGVMGKTKGAALDAGGDKDVGKINGKTALPSGASSKVEADKGPHDQASDKGLGEEAEYELSEETREWLDSLSEEELEEYLQSEEFEALDEISKQTLMSYRGSAKINRRQNDEVIGSQMASNAQVNKAERDNEKRTKGIDLAAKKLQKEEAEEYSLLDMSIEEIEELIFSEDFDDFSGEDQLLALDYVAEKKMDPVGKEDDDIDNDGDVDSSDKYLHKRRKAISKAMKEAFEFIDEETGEELSDEELLEFVDYFVENYELSEEELEEMQMPSKSGKQTKAHVMAKSLGRMMSNDYEKRGAPNKKVSLAGPGGKKITATKTNKTEPGDRYKTEETFLVWDDELQEEFEATFDELMEAGWTEEELMSIEEASMADKAKAMTAKERGANADIDKQRAAEKRADAHGAKHSSGNIKTAGTQGNRDKFKPNKALGAELKAIHGAPDADAARKSSNIDRLKAIKAKVDAKKMKEEFEIEEAEGETLKKVSGEANAKMRPEQEKGKNEPKTKQDTFAGHKPHDQGSDKFETPTKANPKGAVSEESELDEDFKARAEIIFETAVNEKTSIIREEMEAEFANRLDEAKAELNEQVAAYVEEAVQEWIAENALEIKYSLRTELAENFIKGLKGLFEESYVEIPEEEFSVVDELTETVESFKEQLEAAQKQLTESNAELLSMKRASIVESLSEDLTETQKVKLESLAEHVEATDIEEFEYKVKELKEGYFDPKSEQPFIGSLTEEVFTGTEALNENIDESVAVYANFLGKTAR